jgi:hypothetical protein
MSLVTRVSRHLARVIALVVTSLSIAGVAGAQIWTETVDAGSLPATAQHTAGPGSLTTIFGNLETSSDIDVYCIRVASTASFSVKLTCSVTAEDDLYLFNSGGFGVAAFTGCQGGNVSLSNAFLSSIGTYYLAVVPSGLLPRAGADLIWLSAPGSPVERAPDGPGVASPLDNWTGTPSLFQVPYTLRLTGCAYCETAVPASSDAWGRLKVLYR